MSRPGKILIGFAAGAAAGIVVNIFSPDAALVDYLVKNIAQPAGQIFLRLIFMIVVPLVVSSIIMGVFEMGDLKKVGRVGAYTLIYTLAASAISVGIGLALVNLVQPGQGFDPQTIATLGIPQADAAKTIEQAQAAAGLSDVITGLIPKNPIDSAARALDGEMIALMVFSLLFGIALSLARPGQTDDPLVASIATLRDASMKVVDMAMALAPYGVFALVFAMAARMGYGLLLGLGKYVLVVVIGLALQQLVVYSLILKFFSRLSPMEFLRGTREVMLTAFSTSSSNVTLPTSIKAAQENLKLDPGISSFVLTVGSTTNQNGTALFEGVTILFLAQVFGIDLTFQQQLTVMFMSIVAGIGTAGVPGGSLPMIVIVLQSVGVPAEGIGIILGVDRFLDMCRTTLNVTGDLVAACVIDRIAVARQSPGM